MKLVCLILLLSAGLAVAASDEICHVCNLRIDKKFYRFTDRQTEQKVAVCADCEKLESRCFACGLPVKPDAKQLADGRYLCPRDAAAAISDDEEAKKICEAVREDLN